MSSNTSAEFKRAMKELQEVNDELFYNDLKERINRHLNAVKEETMMIEESAKKVELGLNMISDQFQFIAQEAAGQMQAAAVSAESAITNILTIEMGKHSEALGEIYEAFSDISEDQKKFFHDTFSKSVTDTLTEIKQTLSETLIRHENVLSDTHCQLAQLVSAQEKSFLNKEAVWEKIVKNVEQKYDEKLQQLSNTYTKQLKDQQETIKLLEENISHREQELKRLVEENQKDIILVQEKGQETTREQIKNIAGLMEKSAEKYELQLITQNELQQNKLTEQEKHTADLARMQINQGTIMFRWLAIISAVQVIIGVAVGGLYFFN